MDEGRATREAAAQELFGNQDAIDGHDTKSAPCGNGGKIPEEGPFSEIGVPAAVVWAGEVKR